MQSPGYDFGDYQTVEIRGAVSRIKSASSRWHYGAITVLVGMLLGVASGFSHLPLLAPASVCVLMGWILFSLALEPCWLMKYLPFIIEACGNVIGCALCETQVISLTELQTTSHFAGSLPLLCLSWWLFFVTLFLCDIAFLRWHEHDTKTKNASYDFIWLKIQEVLSYIVFILIAIACIHAVMQPSFSLDMDRFGYRNTALVGVWGELDKILPYLIVFPLISLHRGRRFVPLASLSLYVVYLFCIGTRFGGYLALIALATMLFYDVVRKINRKQIVTLFSCAAVIVCGLLVVAVLMFNLSSSGSTATYLPSRLAQQGQLWWRVYEEYEGSAHLDEVTDEFGAVLNYKSVSESVGADNGIYKLMYLFSDANVVDSKLSNGARYTESGYACALYYLGTAGPLLFAVIMALILFMVTQLIVMFLRTPNAIGIVTIFRIRTIYQEALSMFVFGGFFSKTTILTVLLTIIECIANKAIYYFGSKTNDYHNK